MPDDTTLLTQLIRDLSNKVDGLPTRHELDALNNTVGELKTEFNRFVLASEFNSYREYNEQRLNQTVRVLEDRMGSMVPRQEHEARWADEAKRFEALDGISDDYEDRINKLESERTPEWIRNAATGVITAILTAAITAFATHQLPPASPVPTTSTQTSTQTQTSTGPVRH